MIACQIGLLFLMVAAIAASALATKPFNRYLADRISEFDKIPLERREILAKVVAYSQAQLDRSQPIRLTFICTHNSRRSQMAQIWAAVAAQHYGIPNVETFSGGTERTAFNPRAVAALQRAGMEITKTNDSPNPQYEVAVGGRAPLLCFSNVYDESPNPQANFAAVMRALKRIKTAPTSRVRRCALHCRMTTRSRAMERARNPAHTTNDAVKLPARCFLYSRS